jgi:superfamily II DNA or RNA helicase
LAVSKGKRVLFIAHRKEIINQSSQKLDDFQISHGVIMANHARVNDDAVQVASIQTLMRRDKPPADLVIIDEAHLSCSASYKAIVEHYAGATVIGLTATPIRGDGKGLGEVYGDIVSVVSMAQLISEKFLVKPRVFAPFVPNMKKVKISKGDYDAAETAAIMDNAEITGDIIKHWQSHALDRKTIVFASSVEHSKNIVAEFMAANISARHLDANSPANLRDETLQQWRDGQFTVLSNMGLFIEGLDVPAAACCILARPTKSLTIYLQAVGRVMRPAIGKTDCIVLDHAGLTLIHNLVETPREWTLDGKEKAKRDDTPAVAVTVCEHCFCTYSKADNPDFCPECLTDHVKPAPPKVHADGELVELTAEAMLAIKTASKAKWVAEMKAAKTETQLIELGISRGYKHAAGWAGHIMKQRNEWRASRG